MPTYGQDECFKRSVYYTGSDVLRAGYALCYDHDSTTEITTGDGGLRARAYYVEKPTIANAGHFAGLVADGYDGRRGPTEVEVIRPYNARGPLAWTDQNVTAGDLMGIQPGSYALGLGGVVAGAIFRAMQTVDRSATAGTVTGEIGVFARDPAQVCQFYDDFMEGGFVVDAALANESDPSAKFVTGADAGAWLLTAVIGDGALASTAIIIGDKLGGWLEIKPEEDDVDSIALQLNGEAFRFTTGHPLYYETNFQSGDADALILAFGMANTDTAPLAHTDGVMFRIPDATAAQDLNYVLTKAGTETTTTSGVTVADNITVKAAFYYDGNAHFHFYVNDVLMTDPVFTNAPTITEDVSPFMYVRRDGAGSGIVRVDNVLVRQKR